MPAWPEKLPGMPLTIHLYCKPLSMLGGGCANKAQRNIELEAGGYDKQTFEGRGKKRVLTTIIARKHD